MQLSENDDLEIKTKNIIVKIIYNLNVFFELGKVIGMKSWNGHIAWQHYIPGLVPFTRFGREKLLLYTQRTTAHFPHPPQCVVVGRNKVGNSSCLYPFVTDGLAHCDHLGEFMFCFRDIRDDFEFISVFAKIFEVQFNLMMSLTILQYNMAMSWLPK